MTRQPPPIRTDGPCIQDLVIEDLQRRESSFSHLVIEDVRTRKAQGIAKYGTYLQAYNGRDALRDAYEEALDLMQYLCQALQEGAPVSLIYADAIQTCYRLRAVLATRDRR